MVSAILLGTRRPMMWKAWMLKICTTRQNVTNLMISPFRCHVHYLNPAKKEDNPDEALKEFRAIVDQEKEKGDWYVSLKLY